MSVTSNFAANTKPQNILGKLMPKCDVLMSKFINPEFRVVVDNVEQNPPTKVGFGKAKRLINNDIVRLKWYHK